MQHARPVIEKRCKSLGVDPVDVFASLLHALETTLTMGSIQHGFAATASNQTNILNELQLIVQFAQATEMPPSLLHAMEMNAKSTLAGQRRNEESLIRQSQLKGADPKLKDEAERHHRSVVNVLEAVVLILRDIINRAEHAGLDARLFIDDRMKGDDTTGGSLKT